MSYCDAFTNKCEQSETTDWFHAIGLILSFIYWLVITYTSKGCKPLEVGASDIAFMILSIFSWGIFWPFMASVA